MPEVITPVAQWCAVAVEAVGIAIITGAAFYVLAFGTVNLLRRDRLEDTYQKIRLRLGRGILLGLEFLIAADIIQTVAVELTFRNVSVLAMVVAIRTFLSFTLEMEVSGRWPWQQPR